MISTIFQPLGGSLLAVVGPQGSVLYTSDALGALLRGPKGAVAGHTAAGLTAAGFTEAEFTGAGSVGAGFAAAAAGELTSALHGRDGGVLSWPLPPGEYPVRLAAAARGPLPLQLRVRPLGESALLYSFEVEADRELLSLGNVFDQLPLLLLVLSVQGRVLYFNRMAQHYTGLDSLTAGSIIGMDDRDYSELTGRSRTQADFRTGRLREALRTRQSVYWTERHNGERQQEARGPGGAGEEGEAGDFRFLRLCYTPLLGQGGEPVLVLAHGQDISRETRDYVQARLLSGAVQEGRDMVIVAELREQLFDSPVALLNREAQRRLSRLGAELGGGLGGGKPGSLLRQPLGELVRRFLTPEQQERLPLTVNAVLARQGGPADAADAAGSDSLPLLELGLGTAAERRFEVVLSVIRPFEELGGPLFLADEDRAFSGTSYLVTTLRDVTSRERRQHLEEGRARALQLSVGGAALEVVLAELVAAAESQLPGMRGMAALLRDGGMQLMAAGNGAGWNGAGSNGVGPDGAGGTLPAQRPLPPDLERLDKPVGAALPLLEAARSGETVLRHFPPQPAPEQEPPRASQAEAKTDAGGVQTVWAVPICGLHGDGLGTLALYCTTRREPQGGELETLRQLSRIAGLSVESWRAQDRLSKMVYLDPLTRLPNRHALMLALEEAVHGQHAEGAQGAGEPAFLRRVALGLLDLDGFRAINERLGQASGDRVLRRVAARLSELAEQPEWRTRLVLARLGGDEFALLLHLRADDELERLSAQVQGALAGPLELDGQVLQLRGSIGWSLSPDLSLDPADLLVQADVAMYTARQHGQPWRLYSQHGGQWSLNPMTIRAALEGALERGELHLVYHPLIGRCGEGDDGRGPLRGFEALLRWTHPEYGVIGPQEFIPVAEMSGLIRHIGGWVLRQALADARGWPASTVVNVNISSRQFEHPDFLSDLEAALEESAFPPQRLTLELTESALLIGAAQVETVLERVRVLGVRVALDDYGVGYSNLGRLRQMRLSSLKIDRSFTRDLLRAPTPPQRVSPEAAIIRSAVSLAHDLGLEVVVEGVETEAQWAAAQDLGCDVGQGYLFSRPMLSEQTQAWLRGWDG